MSPDRHKIVNGKKVEEYYWAGKMVVYVDNWAVTQSFDEIDENTEIIYEKIPS